MKDREELIIKVMHFMAEKLKDSLVLKGAMQLRLQGSYRLTQDINYVLLSVESKKVLVKKIKKYISELREIRINDVELNFRGIFIEIESQEQPGLKTLLEINILSSLHMIPENMSTVALSNQYKLSGRVISVMALPEAFAHKIAASLERNSMRDIYDLFILEPLSNFDVTTLFDRLKRLSVLRGNPERVTFKEAANRLRKKGETINASRIEKELGPLLPLDQIKGIKLVLKATVARVAEKMERSGSEY
jgi:predicted nucleotidyltransferase component of viral defense system